MGGCWVSCGCNLPIAKGTVSALTEFITTINDAARSPLGWLLVPILLAVFGKFYLFKGWAGKLFTFTDKLIDRYFDEKHQQIEVQVELEIQIKAMLATNNELQTHLRTLLEDRSLLGQTLKDLTTQIGMLAEGLWEDRRTLNVQLAKFERVWQTIGIQPEGGKL
jgi:hypothetical protein